MKKVNDIRRILMQAVLQIKRIAGLVCVRFLRGVKTILLYIVHQITSIRQSLFPASEKRLREDIPPETLNPYIAARCEWNFMMGDIVKAKYNWQQIAYILGVAHIVLLAGLITLALQKQFVPYVVNVDSLGNAQFSALLHTRPTASDVSPLMINAMLRRYITTARSVISDPIAQKHELDFVYQVTKNTAKTVLDTYYQKNNPFDIAKTETIDVTINTVLPKSTQTWQIDWTENHHDLDGHETESTHFEGLITVEQHTPSHADELNVNPLGLYITHLSWAIQQ